MSISQFIGTLMQESKFPLEVENVTGVFYPPTIMDYPTNEFGIIPLEIELGNTLNINSQLSKEQKNQLFNILREHKDAFS